tara:strand:- start:2576 stop:3895 length:1320 start_codon:yes stop_codon:yes gene_type:complete
MAEENQTKEEAGIGSILDRLETQLNESSGADSLAQQRDAGAGGDPNQEEKSGGDLEDLEDIDGLRDAEGVKGVADPLDTLSEDANKGTGNSGTNSSEDVDAEGGNGPTHSDILSEFDAPEQAKIQAYLDDKIAEELRLTESAGGAFKRLKGENRDLEGKVQELESRTAEPEALKAATERISELEAQVQVNEEAKSVLRLEDTEAYRQAVVEPQQAILAASDGIADRYGVDRDELADILGNPNRRELSDTIGRLLGDDVADADKFELYDLSRRAESTFSRKYELANNAEAALTEAEELAGKARERQALDERQIREVSARDTVTRLKEKASFILDIVGEDAVSGFVDANAERPVESLNPADQSFARFAFDALIPLAKHVRKLEGELQVASDDNLKLRGSTPGGGGSGGGNPTDAESQTKEPDTTDGIESAVDRINRALQGP